MTFEPLRMDISRIAPDAYRKLAQLESTVAQHVEPKLLHLLKLRASQINGCAYCIVMHTHEALQAGESPIKLTSLDAWEESDQYNERERVLLRWVDEVTLVASTHASAGAFADLKSHFDESEIGWLTMAIVTINSWNRVAIASRAQYRTTQAQPEISN